MDNKCKMVVLSLGVAANLALFSESGAVELDGSGRVVLPAEIEEVIKGWNPDQGDPRAGLINVNCSCAKPKW